MKNRPLPSRRTVLAAATGAVLAPFMAHGADMKIPTIGYLEPIHENNPTNRINLAAFHKGLSELGFVEGKSVKMIYHFGEGDLARIPGMAQDLVDRKVDLIVAGTPNAARPVMAATKTIPIVFGQASDAVDNNMVKNREHPEGNITGIGNFNQFGPRRLELICDVVPGSAPIAYLTDHTLGSYERNLQQTQEAADRLKRKLIVLKANTDAEIDAAFKAVAEQRPGGLYVGPVQGASRHPDYIAKLAAQARVPTIYFNRTFVDVGGLMSYGVAFRELWYLVGTYAGKILAGAKPGDLPVHGPATQELVLNMATAKSLGLTFPPPVLSAATEKLA